MSVNVYVFIIYFLYLCLHLLIAYAFCLSRCFYLCLPMVDYVYYYFKAASVCNLTSIPSVRTITYNIFNVPTLTDNGGQMPPPPTPFPKSRDQRPETLWPETKRPESSLRVRFGTRPGFPPVACPSPVSAFRFCCVAFEKACI